MEFLGGVILGFVLGFVIGGEADTLLTLRLIRRTGMCPMGPQKRISGFAEQRIEGFKDKWERMGPE